MVMPKLVFQVCKLILYFNYCIMWLRRYVQYTIEQYFHDLWILPILEERISPEAEKSLPNLSVL